MTVTVTTGTTRISGVGPIGIFGQNGAVRLKAPTDGIAKPVVDWRAPGQLANVEIIIGGDANDVGLRIQGNVLPELTVRDVNVTGYLPQCISGAWKLVAQQ